MGSSYLLKAEGVSKKFSKSLNKSLRHGLVTILREFMGLRSNKEIKGPDEFWAVKNINFELKAGQSLGLIGRNGSGKSTLLKILNGLMDPDKGTIEINGRLGAMIEVGAGFHPLLTGRENVFLYGASLGMSRETLKKDFDAIVDFAGVKDFIDVPVKHYSSGMYVRLAFSIAAHSCPEILLVDEVLAVGDYAFQLKCIERIKKIKEQGTSIILVSHSDAQLRAVCDSGLVLNEGKEVIQSSIDEALLAYYPIANQQIIEGLSLGQTIHSSGRRGNGQARFKEVFFENKNHERITRLPAGEEYFYIVAPYKTLATIKDPRFFFFLRDARKTECIILGGISISHCATNIQGDGIARVKVDSRDIAPGLWGVFCGITDSTFTDLAYDGWDINGTVLEIYWPQGKNFKEELLSRPYMMIDCEFSLQQG